MRMPDLLVAKKDTSLLKEDAAHAAIEVPVGEQPEKTENPLTGAATGTSPAPGFPHSHLDVNTGVQVEWYLLFPICFPVPCLTRENGNSTIHRIPPTVERFLIRLRA